MYRIGISIMVLMAFIFGCNPENANRAPLDGHLHGEADSQLTLFSENIEFFIDYEPLEVRTESKFLVHITDLSSYKPCPPGSVTILIDGLSVTSEQPAKPGIFEVPFIPQKAGSFQAEFSFKSAAISETVSGQIYIYQEDHDPESEGAAEGEHAVGHDDAGEIVFSKEQAWKSKFMVAEVQLVSFSSVIPTSGEIMAVPGEKKSVSAHGRGMVHFSNRYLVQGSPVQTGQLLFTISTESMIDNNVKLQYQEAQNRYEKSRNEYFRHQKLYAQGVISERQFIASRSGFKEDSLRFHSLASKTSEEGFRVYAPATGTIHELNVSEGAFVETGQLMATISSNRKLLVRADLSQQFFNQLNEIETANFRPAYSDRTFPMEEVNGRLLASGASVAENDHYLPIIFEVENDGSLLEGAFTEVYLKTSRKNNVLAVPMTSLSEEQGTYYLYVQVTGESYTKRAVTPGRNDGMQIEILNGILPGERVVTDGVMLVKTASMVTGAVGQGHSH